MQLHGHVPSKLRLLGRPCPQLHLQLTFLHLRCGEGSVIGALLPRNQLLRLPGDGLQQLLLLEQGQLQLLAKHQLLL